METGKFFGQNPEEIAKGIAERKQKAIEFESYRSIYMDLYPNEWVAYHAGEIVAHSHDFDEFFEKLDDVGNQIGDSEFRKKAFVQYLDPNPPTLIL